MPDRFGRPCPSPHVVYYYSYTPPPVTHVPAPVPVTSSRSAVAPQPFSPTSSSLSGSSLLEDLRRTALTRSLGSRTFNDIMPEIRRRIGSSLATDPEAINFQIHTSASAIQSRLNGITPMITPNNGLLGEFNRVITFSVPATTGNLDLRAYYFTDPCAITSGWNHNSSFSPHSPRTLRQRSSDVYEVHIRREGNQLHYTIALTHGFVGGLRIGVGGRNFLVFSHDDRPAPPPPVVVRSEPPAQTQIAIDPPLAPTLGDPPSDVPLVSSSQAGSQSLLPPRNSSENLDPPLAVVSAPPPPAEEQAATEQLALTPLTPPSLPEVNEPNPELLSGLLASLPSFDIGPSWLTVNPLLSPRTSPEPRPDRIETASLSVPLLPEGDDLPLVPSGSAGSGGSGGSGGTELAVVPSDPPRLNHTGPVVASRRAWEGIDLGLPRFIPETVVTSPENRTRAANLSTLALFSLYQWSGDIDAISQSLGDNQSLRNTFEEYVAHSYYLPQRAFQTLSAFLRAARDEDNDSERTRTHLSGAITGLAENPDSGTRWGVETRMARLLRMIAENPRLSRDAVTNIRTLRGRMLGISRPLYWSTLYAYQRQVEDADAGNNPAPPPLSAVVRRTTHHVAVSEVRNSLLTIFGAEAPPSRHRFQTFLAQLRANDPNQIESVHNLTSQDLLAMRQLIARAREARNSPAFVTHFTASRTDTMRAALVSRLGPNGENPPSPAAVEAYLRSVFGDSLVTSNRTEILRLVGTLSTNNTPQRRAEVAAAILQPFATQMQFGDAQLRELDAGLTHLQGYANRIRILLRAQVVADNTDNAVGGFLAILNDVDGSPVNGGAAPTQGNFQTRLTAALDALESEYALLGGDQVGGAYATQRRGVLLRLHQDLRRHLVDGRSPWRTFLTGNTTRDALRARLDRATPASRTAATLPADNIEVIEGINEVMRRGISAFQSGDVMRTIERFIGR